MMVVLAELAMDMVTNVVDKEGTVDKEATDTLTKHPGPTSVRWWTRNSTRSDCRSAWW